MMTFDELQDMLTGKPLYWNGCCGDHKDVIDHIIAKGSPTWSYEIHFKCGDYFRLKRPYMEDLVVMGQTTVPPFNGPRSGDTLRWRESPHVEKVTSDNTNDAHIDWEQRTWDVAKMLYCQMPYESRFAREAVQEAKAFIAAYRKLMKR